MKIRHTFALTIFCLMSVAYAQEYEYGAPEEMLGAKTYFVNAGPSLGKRNTVVAEISKELPELKIVDDIPSADIVLFYKSSAQVFATGSTAIYATSIIRYQAVIAGEGSVVKIVERDGEQKIRILMDFGAAKKSSAKINPAILFARRFIKTYREVSEDVQPVFIAKGFNTLHWNQACKPLSGRVVKQISYGEVRNKGYASCPRPGCKPTK